MPCSDFSTKANSSVDTTNELRDSSYNPSDESREIAPVPRSPDMAVPTTTIRVSGKQLHDTSWRWQKSCVRRSVPVIRHQYEKIRMQSTLLQQQNVRHDATGVGVFHRREIQTGRLLGTGGFSEVYEIVGFRLDPLVSARCTRVQQELRQEYAASALEASGLGGRYAIKCLKAKLLLQETTPQDFQQAAVDLVVEGAYLAVLDHPHILALRGLPIDGISAFRNGDREGYFLMTDRLDGTLRDRIKAWKTTSAERVPSVPEKLQLASQVASALHYLHTKHRIVFRDLKPHNMGFVVTADTDDSTSDSVRIQLFDFGLCRELPPGATDDTDDEKYSADEVFNLSVAGTHRYMAPEIINDGRYNTKVDVYSWAMVTWELLTGKCPYSKMNRDQHRLAVCQCGERPQLYMHWPEWLQNLLLQTWCASVTDRWSIDKAVRYLEAQLASHQHCRTQSILISPVGVCQLDVEVSDLTHLFIPDLDLVDGDHRPRLISLMPRHLNRFEQ